MHFCDNRRSRVWYKLFTVNRFYSVRVSRLDWLVKILRFFSILWWYRRPLAIVWAASIPFILVRGLIYLSVLRALILDLLSLLNIWLAFLRHLVVFSLTQDSSCKGLVGYFISDHSLNLAFVHHSPYLFLYGVGEVHHFVLKVTKRCCVVPVLVYGWHSFIGFCIVFFRWLF